MESGGLGMIYQTEVLIANEAQGEVMRLDAPISFWGGVDPTTSKITLANHPQIGQKISGKILVIPTLIGSSSSSAILLELIYSNVAPKALILGGRDAILPIGVVVAEQLGLEPLPVLMMENPPFQSGEMLRIDVDGSIHTNGNI